MKPVIFLDFDGVLNSLRSTLAMGGAGAHQFDAVAVNLVARLAGAADANVVVSSAWRIGSDVPGLKRVLGEYSTALTGRVIDVTPRGMHGRGAEIAEWLATNPSKHNGSFVIIDDDADMLDGQLPHFVQTKHRDGFGVPEYLKALEILAPNHKDLTNLGYYRGDKPEPGKLIVLEWDA
jgi:hypothetical protein